MKTKAKYKIFLHEKSIDELRFNSSLWVSELDFVGIEISFIIQLLKSYPIKTEIPNLFEHIQLFNKELEILEKERNIIIDNIHQYKNELSGMIECDKLSCDNVYVIAYEKLAKYVFKFLQSYKKLKIEIYEFLNNILV